jgi:hypothetical protein
VIDESYLRVVSEAMNKRLSIPQWIYLVWLAVLFCASVLVPANAEPPPPHEATATASVQAIQAEIGKPASIRDVLKNLKFAMEHDLLIQLDLYNDEVLRQLFGAKQIVWLENKKTKKFASLKEFGSISAERRLLSKTSGSVILDVDAHAKLRGSANLTPASPLVTVEMVKEIFGSKFEVGSMLGLGSPQHPLALMPTTRELGNSILTYRFHSAVGNGSANVITNGDATVNRINFIEEEK